MKPIEAERQRREWGNGNDKNIYILPGEMHTTCGEGTTTRTLMKRHREKNKKFSFENRQHTSALCEHGDCDPPANERIYFIFLLVQHETAFALPRARTHSSAFFSNSIYDVANIARIYILILMRFSCYALLR